MTPTDRLNRPARDLRISVTDRCNFRCDYCMPKETFGEQHRFLPRDQVLNFEEMTRLARLCVERLGVTKLRITGGEPLLRRELPKLIESFAQIPGLEDLTLTTNGYLLAEQAQDLANAGLRRVTVSLDSLDPQVFAQCSGMGRELERVLVGIDAAAAAGLTPLKLNCVLRRGVNEPAIEELARHFRGTGHIVRYIEFMDVGTLNGWNTSFVVPEAEIIERLSALGPLSPLPAADQKQVARRFRFDDDGTEIGIIASVTRPFCRDCTRARLSAEGQLITCLFASHGADLRGPMRAGESDNQLAQRLVATWEAREDRYSEIRGEHPPAPQRRLEMYKVGG